MKKLFLMSCLFMSFTFGFAQGNTCEFSVNGDFETNTCTNLNSLVSSGCLGPDWNCYHSVPSIEFTATTGYTPIETSNGSTFVLLKTPTKQKTDAVSYTPVTGPPIVSGYYDVSIDAAALISQFGVISTNATLVVLAVETADLTPLCPSSSVDRISLPDDLQVLINESLDAEQGWDTYNFTGVIDVPNNATGSISIIIEAINNASIQAGRAIGIDNFCISEAPCPEVSCVVESSLTTCSETNTTGYIYVNCPEAAVIGWDTPTGSSVIHIGSGNEIALVNASPGTYRLRTIGPEGCETVQEFVITENCCEVDPNACATPTGLSCNNLETYVQVSWDPVPSATSYVVQTIFNSIDCGCGGPELINTYPTSINTYYIPIYQLSNPCFSWQVKAICGEGEASEYSEPQCFSPSSRCDFREEGAVKDEEKAAIGQINKPIVYPNPTVGEVNYQYNMEAAGDLTIDIFDTQGKIIEQYQFKNLESGLFKTELMISKAKAAGLYFINTRTNDKQYQERLMILE